MGQLNMCVETIHYLEGINVTVLEIMPNIIENTRLKSSFMVSLSRRVRIIVGVIVSCYYRTVMSSYREPTCM